MTTDQSAATAPRRLGKRPVNELISPPARTVAAPLIIQNISGGLCA